jgi:NAD(P)-dependent dehydrogenase (short-subunit alcohol dehydrogenase family)
MTLALLTGVGRPGQVGEAVAQRLASDGFDLVLVDRSEENVKARAAEVRAAGGRAAHYAADLADETAVDELFSRIRADHGGELGALVHMAGGFGMTGKVADTSVADWERQLTINLRTTFLVARGSIPMLREKGGSMVFFSSESALVGAKLSSVSAYAVAKSGALTLCTAIAQEEAKSGIRANVLAPAAIRTAQNLADMPPNSRFVEREDVASTVSWLCSDSSAAVTGQVIRLSPR